MSSQDHQRLVEERQASQGRVRQGRLRIHRSVFVEARLFNMKLWQSSHFAVWETGHWLGGRLYCSLPHHQAPRRSPRVQSLRSEALSSSILRRRVAVENFAQDRRDMRAVAVAREQSVIPRIHINLPLRSRRNRRLPPLNANEREEYSSCTIVLHVWSTSFTDRSTRAALQVETMKSQPQLAASPFEVAGVAASCCETNTHGLRTPSKQPSDSNGGHPASVDGPVGWCRDQNHYHHPLNYRGGRYQLN